MTDFLRAGGNHRLEGHPCPSIVAVLLTLFLVPTGSAVAQEESGVSLPLGSEVQAAAVQDLEGNPVELLDYIEEGKPALLEFWATWCELCEALQPQLDRIQADFGDRLNVVAVAVAVSQNPRRILRHLEEHDPGYPYVYDARGEAVRAYAVAATSVVVILDSEGLVAYTGVGADQDLVAAVERILGG
jgi:thiol-disulfide isomerase/thioredoxin